MRSRLAVLGLVVLLLATACGGSSSSPSSSSSKTTADTGSGNASGLSYVALGDSYTAGPLIPDISPESGLCLRSTHNYPSDLVRSLGFAHHADLSCSGATSDDVLHGTKDAEGKVVVPPQVNAVSSATNVVTVGIGGNDGNLFGSLVGECPRVASKDPNGHPCQDELGSQVASKLAVARAGITDVLAEVHRRAPRATVILVGYLTLVPATGTCTLLPFAKGDYTWAHQVQGQLDDTMASAAKAAGDTFVSMRAESASHSACAGTKAWVNGSTSDNRKAYAYHPFASGMSAVAARVQAVLAKDGIS